MAEEEFADDTIDWTTLKLPCKPESKVTESDRQYCHENRSSAFDGNRNTSIVEFSQKTTEITNNNYQNRSTEEELRQQIVTLSNQLRTKTDEIFELEATIATSHAESIHRVQQAEIDAQRRIHLIEEELVRAKREADQYKTNWIRQKKRSNALESDVAHSGEGGGVTNDVWQPGSANNASNPTNVDIFHNHLLQKSPLNTNQSKVSGVSPNSVKKSCTAKVTDVQTQRNTKKKKDEIRSSNNPLPSYECESDQLRIVKHLLLRSEMNCYSTDGNDEDGSSTILGNPKLESTESDDFNRKIECRAENETISFVKSLLSQMITDTPRWTLSDPCLPRAISISGLALILLERFIFLFQCYPFEMQQNDSFCDSLDTDTLGSTVQSPNEWKTNNHRVALILFSSEFALRRGASKSLSPTNLVPLSWRSVLYLLNVLNDIFVLSRESRENFRLWLYQSHSGNSLDTDEGNATKGIENDIEVHPRIEGLPSRMCKKRPSRDDPNMWWKVSSSSNSIENEWDPTTFSRPCHEFHELLVGIMNGNFSPASGNLPSKDFPSALESEKEVAYHAQLKSIDLVSNLLSDAKPYHDSEINQGRTIPHLWKFWLNSLFPTYSAKSETITESIEQMSPAVSPEDFFSIWERSGFHNRGNLLGKGRKCYSRRLDDNSHEFEVKPLGRSDKYKSMLFTKNEEQSVLTSINLKYKILQLLNHFILSSNSVHDSFHTIYNSSSINFIRDTSKHASEGVSLAKRMLFAVLDEIDEFILPFLCTWHTLDLHRHGIELCLKHCQACVLFLLAISRSDIGIHLLRLQIRLDVEINGRSRWSASAISCVISILDYILIFAMEKEEKKLMNSMKANVITVINTIVELCIFFFKNLLHYVNSSYQSGSEPSQTRVKSFSALISEQYLIFLSCCDRIIVSSNLDVRDELKQEMRIILEEVLLDGQDDSMDK